MKYELKFFGQKAMRGEIYAAMWAILRMELAKFFNPFDDASRSSLNTSGNSSLLAVLHIKYEIATMSQMNLLTLSLLSPSIRDRLGIHCMSSNH